MAAPLATEKVLRGTLQALQRGGLVSSGSDVSKLEQIPNNATDQDISDILDTIVFGGISAATDVIRGDEDVNVFVDADDNDSTLTRRYFRISQDQSDPPVTDPEHELMTMSARSFSGGTSAELIVGPRTSIAGAGTYTADIQVGATGSGYYGSIWGGPSAVATAHDGIRMEADDHVGLQADTYILATNQGGTAIRGGWESLSSAARFHVGDPTSSPPESLTIERNVLAGPIYTYTLRPTDDTGAGIKSVYFRGSNATNDYRSFWCVGGKAGETWGNPNNLGNATLAVVGDDNSTTASAAYFYDRKSTRTLWSTAVGIQCNTAAGGNFYYFRIFDSLGGGVFNVDSSGNVNADGPYSSGGGDVAELVAADAEYKPGTVLCLQGGGFTQTTRVGQANVAGVVATAPGVLLGTVNDYDRTHEFQLRIVSKPGQTDVLTVKGDVQDRIGQYIRIEPRRFIPITRVSERNGLVELSLGQRIVVYEGMHCYGGVTKQENLNRMAITGIVPVMCSTAQGDIEGNGEFLVSGPDGCAVVDPDPKPGTIIGKAKGTLVSNGSTVKGLVEALVNLQ